MCCSDIKTSGMALHESKICLALSAYSVCSQAGGLQLCLLHLIAATVVAGAFHETISTTTVTASIAALAAAAAAAAKPVTHKGGRKTAQQEPQMSLAFIGFVDPSFQ